MTFEALRNDLGQVRGVMRGLESRLARGTNASAPDDDAAVVDRGHDDRAGPRVLSRSNPTAEEARRMPHAGSVARRRGSLSSPPEPKSTDSHGYPRRSGQGADTFANSKRRTRQ